MSDISPSSITTDAEFEKQIAGADFETIKTLMAERAVQQGLVQRDAYDPSVLIPVESGTAPQKFFRAVTIKGQTQIVEAESEIALEKAVGNLYRADLQPAAGRPVRNSATDLVVEQGKHDEDTAANPEQRAALDLQFQLGQISVKKLDRNRITSPCPLSR
jgi:hypothetical protein